MLYRLLVAGLSLASVVCALLALRGAPQAGESLLHASPTLAHLGVLGQGETASATFQLSNHSDRPIHITSVYGGCSCTSHELSASTIPPDEAAALSLSYSSGSSRGAVSTDATVYYVLDSDPQIRALKCTLTAEVEPNIRIVPEHVQFTAGRDAKQVVELRPGRLASFSIERCSATHPAFRVERDEGTGDASRRQVALSFEASTWTPVHGPAELVIVTNDEVAPVLRIPLLVSAGDGR